MLKIKSVIALLITVFMLCLVGCTGDPAPEVEQQTYNTTFQSDQSTQATSKITQVIEEVTDVETADETIIQEQESTIETNNENFISQEKQTKKNIKNKVANKTKSSNNKVIATFDNDKATLEQNISIVDKTKITVVKTVKATFKNITTLSTTQEDTTTTSSSTQTTTLAPLSDDDICYVTANGERYHRQGCRYLNRSCIEIIVSEAKEQGYTPCKVCKP